MSRLPTIANPQRKPYPSDLSDAEWEILKPLLPLPKGFGHPVEVDLREIQGRHFLRAAHVLPVGNAPEAICRPTAQCMATLRNGSAKGFGSKFMTRYDTNCAQS